MAKLRIYRVRDDYVEFLRRFDSKNVKYNKDGKRPYVGVVLQIETFRYFAPLASPKLKHLNMKESIDFIKINNGKNGAVNLNNMIPIVEQAIIIVDIPSEPDLAYRNLLFDQAVFLSKNSEMISTKAAELYSKVTKHNSYLRERCVDFKLLEAHIQEYSLDIPRVSDKIEK